ncbi:MAG TPA: bacterial transcriptional activator domain-containing protein [Streptosporangiaceae bacterium]|nr:bacterial transcriptional activator domain-containing protein [Streptosporangiaceae bacterium]
MLLPQPIFSRLSSPLVFGLGMAAGALAVVLVRGTWRWRSPGRRHRSQAGRLTRPVTQPASQPASAPVAVTTVRKPARADRPPAGHVASLIEVRPGAQVPGDLAVVRRLLPNLEKLKVTLAVGPAGLVDRLLDAAVSDLSAGVSVPCELILVGFGPAAGSATTAHCAQVTSALDLLAARTVAARRSLGEAARPAGDPAGTDRVLTVLVSKVAATASELSMLIDLVNEHGRAAALLAAHPGQGAGQAAVLELGHGRGSSGPLVTRLRTGEEAQPAGRGAQETRAGGLRIGVLGQLTINGQPGALLPAQTQLIVALALHGRTGLRNRQLCELLGTDSEHPKPADSLRQLIARTRRQLGQAADGQEWIEHLGHGRYGLHSDSRLDWREFETLTDDGIAAGDAGKLAAALAMIRGQPFTGCFYWWLDIEMVDTVSAKILAAASTLSELSLDRDDPVAAARAARIGLVADGTSEQLWRLLMRAEHAAGNLAGVREAWARCADAVADIAADGQPDPSTAALYRHLLSR